MGNTFPVVEHKESPVSLMGYIEAFKAILIHRQSLQSGFNSHYVVVNRNGNTPSREEKNTKSKLYDEIVINQESQIAPAYIVRLNPTEASKYLEDWSRDRPSAVVGLEVHSHDDTYISLLEIISPSFREGP